MDYVFFKPQSIHYAVILKIIFLKCNIELEVFFYYKINLQGCLNASYTLTYNLCLFPTYNVHLLPKNQPPFSLSPALEHMYEAGKLILLPGVGAPCLIPAP